VTFTEIVQLEPALMLPPVSEIVLAPGLAVTVLLEPQVPLSPLGLSTTRLAGSVSVNATPLSEPLEFGLVIVTDSELVPPTAIEVGVNALVVLGGLVAAAAIAGTTSAATQALVRSALIRASQRWI
jgi:hypothetical protein